MAIVVDIEGVGPTEFEDENQATAYFKASQGGQKPNYAVKANPIASPNTVFNNPYLTAAQETGGDDKGTKKDLDLAKTALEVEEKARNLEALSPRQSVENILHAQEQLLERIPSGESGPMARVQGLIQKAKGWAGYSPEVGSYEGVSKGTLAPLIRYMGEKGALAEGDVGRAITLIPGVTDPYSYRREKMNQLRGIIGLEPTQSNMGPGKFAVTRQQPAAAAPSAGRKRYNPATDSFE